MSEKTGSYPITTKQKELLGDIMSSKSYKKLLINKEHSIKNAMERLDEIALRNLFVVNENNQLLGALSDGDIRRAILSGRNLEDIVENVMNSEPKYIYLSDRQKDKTLKKIMLKFGIEAVPVLNKDKVVLDIAFWVDVFATEKTARYSKKDNKVFVLAGGIGSRLEPFTRILPKPLIPIGEQPIIEKIMDKFAHYGFDKFILSLNYKAEMIKVYFNDPDLEGKYSSIEYVQEDFPLGTIGSLYLAANKIKDSFFITNSDIFVEADLEKIFCFHKESGAVMTVVGCIKNAIIPYGVLSTDDRGFLVSIKEKPSYKNVVNVGIYIAEPEIISYLKLNVRMDITEIIEQMLKEQKKISVYPVFEEQWFDVGQWVEYERTKKYFEK